MPSSTPGHAEFSSCWRNRTDAWPSRFATTAAASTQPPAAALASPASPTRSPSCTGPCASTTHRGEAPRCTPRFPSPRRSGPMAEPLRVVIADDNYLVREGTRRLLEESGQVTVQAAVGSAPELLDAVRRAPPDAVLTDIRMPPACPPAGRPAGPAKEGIDAAHAIKASFPGVGVVILSQYADESYAFELFRNGTSGLAYLLKDRIGDLRQLLAALRAVAAGGSAIGPHGVDAPVARLARLTPRELDVLREMAQGQVNAGIAQKLSVSESTVEKNVNAIFTKLGLTSEQLVHRRVAAVLTFLRDAGLRPPG